MSVETLARKLKDQYTESLSLRYELGGYIDGDTFVEIRYPSPPPESVFIYPAPYRRHWHTHPGKRGHTYEAPNGADITAAAEMSVDLGQPVEGFALEDKGVWWYQVHVTTEMLKVDPDLLDNLYFFATNLATNLGGIQEEIDLYDEKYRLSLKTVQEYLDRWKDILPRLSNAVELRFYQ